MEDNCRIHKSVATMALKTELGIQTLEWPSYSPDLNLIENLWKLWKDRVQKTHPQPINHEELIQVSIAAWEGLKVTDIGQALTDSVKRCLAAVKAAKGHLTKY